MNLNIGNNRDREIDEKTERRASDIDFNMFVPFGTAALILIGVSRLIYYYQYFKINIISFLDLTEIITSFLNSIFLSILILVIILVTVLSQIFLLFRGNGKDAIKINTKKLNGFLMNYMAIVTLLAAAMFQKSTFSFLWYNNSTTLMMMLLYLVLGSFLYIVYTKQSYPHLKQISLISIIFLYVEFVILVAVYSEIKDLVQEHKNLGTRIVFNNETFMQDSSHVSVSDSSNFYIGKTNNYIFIHHQKTKTTSVYLMSSVKQIDFKFK